MQEIIEKLKVYGIVLFWSFIGISAKISSINRGQKITKRQAVMTICTGLFSGFLCSAICDYYKIDGHLKAALISVAALSGENVTAWILGNIDSFLDKFKANFLKKGK